MITVNLIKREIDEYLKGYFEDKQGLNKELFDSMSYSLNIGGKRIRPILTILTYSLYKDDWKKVIPFAAAIEMIHTYSLIHDDLPCMDDDDLRRGKPTNHKVFGEAVAVLAGDALLNEAFNIIIKFSIKEGRAALLATEQLGEAAGANGMIGGQLVDILSENKSITKDELYYIHEHKTGALIKASVLAGAILGGADKEELVLLEKYGENLGLAFQIKDDILDVEGNKELIGKNINSDAENHKYTFVSLLGLEDSKALCKQITNNCIESLKSLKYNTVVMEELTNFLLERNY
ncbi:polyprenyl synthetase family protein [Alloiococcus sp. CFN-8]|uniref:polyprenyl synthetase family protein n=1 Tax=Alloiococcus sp. CFN-8 TaxID=3416081 RepID=UPI003CF7351B